MQLIRGFHKLKPKHQKAIVAIGNFDGVHLGHKELIKRVKEIGQAMERPTLLIIFEPQPLEYLKPTSAVPRLTRFREKFYYLNETGIDYLLIVKFNQTFSQLTADEFIERLYKQLAVHYLIVGTDFRFGKARQGDVALLKEAGEKQGFTVEIMPDVKINNERVSSTRIRQNLLSADLVSAELLLGRPYAMMGRVVYGSQLGRQLGFPTANIFVHRMATPLHGIYVVRLKGLNEKGLLGVANIGTRPSVSGTQTLLEVYLFNFNQDIYGKYVIVEFYQKLRDEERFENLTLLKMQIAKDVEQARQYFIEKGELT